MTLGVGAGLFSTAGFLSKQLLTTKYQDTPAPHQLWKIDLVAGAAYAAIYAARKLTQEKKPLIDSAMGPGSDMSSMRMVWRSPMPLETTTLPRPVIISKKLRASEMDMILAAGISLVCSHKKRYRWLPCGR